MKMYGVDVAEGSSITNAVLPHGTTFPTSVSTGELFFKTDGEPGIYVYNGTSWAAANSMFSFNTGPLFGAYQSTEQSLTSAEYTKVLLQTEEFDTNNAFSNSRFQPTIPGYYQVSASVSILSTVTQVIALIYKNGVAYKRGNNDTSAGSSVVNALVYLNGSTDYIELYAYSGATQNTLSGQAYTYMTCFGITNESPSNHLTDYSMHLTSGQNTLLDGITATATELNQTSGAVSNIQTQLNAKPAINPLIPKDGDIQVSAGPTIQVYAGGSWNQIFPVIYS